MSAAGAEMGSDGCPIDTHFPSVHNPMSPDCLGLRFCLLSFMLEVRGSWSLCKRENNHISN